MLNFIHFIMLSFLNLTLFIFTAIVVHKVVILASSFNRKSWKGTGRRLQFTLLSLSLGLIAGGAVGVLFGFPWGGEALLCGVGGRFAFDRRLFEMHRSVVLSKSERNNTTFGNTAKQ